jgi:hypothetical protein
MAIGEGVWSLQFAAEFSALAVSQLSSQVLLCVRENRVVQAVPDFPDFPDFPGRPRFSCAVPNSEQRLFQRL